MKKTILLAALVLITAFCICYGTYKHTGGFKGNFHFSFDDDEDWQGGESSDEKRGEINEGLEKFSSITIDAAIMALTIEQGEDFRIESSFNKEYLKPVFSVEGGKLTIKQAGKKKRGINGGSHNCRVVVTIPSGTRLDSISIDSNVGDVRLRKLTADDIDINLNVGEISVRDVAFNNIDCDNNVGEISIYPEGNLDDFSMSLSTDVGEVHVDGKRYKKNYNVRSNGSKTIKANTNVGEINVR